MAVLAVQEALVAVLVVQEASVEVLVIQVLVVASAVQEAMVAVLAVREVLVVLEVMVVAMAHHMDMVFKTIRKDHSSRSMIKFIMMNFEEMY